MNISIILIMAIILIAIVSTLILAGKGDEGYSNSTKRNTANLISIYVVVIILALLAIGIYIRWFA